VVFTNSFFRSAFELLYTPLPPLVKRPTKTIIDVASDRLGDVLGSGVLLLLLALTPTLPPTLVIGVAILVAVITLFIVRRLYRGYVEQLATSLRDGAISLSDDQVVDATTRHTLAEASGASEREILMTKIRRMKQERGAAGQPFAGDDIDAEQAADDAVDPEVLSEASAAVADLMSGSTARIRRCLASPLLDVRLVPYLIPLLANDEIAEDIRMELRWKAPQTIGALADALLDPDVQLLARQRIPSVLEVTHNPRAVDALFTGLDDEEFNVRYSCARALARMNERDAHMEIPPADVFRAVEREVSVDRSVWISRDLEVNMEVPTDMAPAAMAGDPRIDYSMEHVFTLLSLILDHDALMLSRQAVLSSDRNLRGTALEYLENVLPENVRRGLWPHFGEAVAAPRRRRARGEVIADLKRAVDPE
jgi:ATP:ADP antiporter, AAA family